VGFLGHAQVAGILEALTGLASLQLGTHLICRMPMFAHYWTTRPFPTRWQEAFMSRPRAPA
jgi:hypothetical protein